LSPCQDPFLIFRKLKILRALAALPVFFSPPSLINSPALIVATDEKKTQLPRQSLPKFFYQCFLSNSFFFILPFIDSVGDSRSGIVILGIPIFLVLSPPATLQASFSQRHQSLRNPLPDLTSDFPNLLLFIIFFNVSCSSLSFFIDLSGVFSRHFLPYF